MSEKGSNFALTMLNLHNTKKFIKVINAIEKQQQKYLSTQN